MSKPIAECRKDGVQINHFQINNQNGVSVIWSKTYISGECSKKDGEQISSQ